MVGWLFPEALFSRSVFMRRNVLFYDASLYTTTLRLHTPQAQVCIIGVANVCLYVYL